MNVPFVSKLSMVIATLLSATAFAEGKPNPPIVVEADSFEIRLDLENAVWRGDVRAQQGNYTFRTESLTIHLEQVATQNADEVGNNTGNQQPLDNRFILSAQHLSYDVDQDTIMGHGGCEISRGQEKIRANQIVLYAKEKRAMALPETNGRVLVSFFSNPNKPIFPGTFASNAADIDAAD